MHEREREEKRLKLAIMCNIYNFEVPVDDEAKKLPKLFFIDMKCVRRQKGEGCPCSWCIPRELSHHLQARS